MPSRAYTSFLPLPKWMIEVLFKCVNALSGLYLISTVTTIQLVGPMHRVNALSGLYLISTLLNFTVHRHKYVSMPSRAYTSFLH